MSYYKHYSLWHQDTEESKNRDILDCKNFIKLHNLLPKNDAKILELGCGLGRFMLALRELGCFNIIGVDFTAEFIDVAKKYNLDVIQKEILEFLKEDKNLYDAIYCLDVIEHISKEYQEELFVELYKHLSPQGFIAIKTVNALSPMSQYFRYIDLTHQISYTPESIKYLASCAGFEELIIRPEHEENEELQELKTPYAEIYRKQFFLEDIILTPNIVVILFKDRYVAEKYSQKVLPINNDYKNGYVTEKLTIKNIFKYCINRIFLKLSFGKIDAFELKNIKYKFMACKYKK